MKVTISRLEIENFKGITSLAVNFTDHTKVKGANGVGKTTMADAIFWALTGKDSELVDNPLIAPMNATECTPTVKLDLNIDGKQIFVRKVQKFKSKDGKESTSNSYFINEVPMTERDFKAKLESYGINIERMPILMHPDFLLRDTSKKGREYIRNKILFPMAQEISDKEIADNNGLKNLSALLETYTVSEIDKLEKAIISKVNDQNGKDNKVAFARIDQLNKNKSGTDANNLRKQVAETEKKLADCLAKKDKLSAQILEIEQENLKLSFDRNSVVSSINDKATRAKMEIDEKLANKMKELEKARNEKLFIEDIIVGNQQSIDKYDLDLETLEQQLKEAEVQTFDSKATICPTCGQEYPPEKVKAIQENFIEQKNKSIQATKDKISQVKRDIKALESRNNEVFPRIDYWNDTIDTLANECEQLRKDYGSYEMPDATQSEEYKALDKKIKDCESRIDELKENNIDDVERNLRGQLKALNADLVKAGQDEAYDKQIAEIREQIKTGEVSKAEAEEILFEVEQLGKIKNEMLEESINKYFSIVKWKLFRTLKNGSVEDACIPIIDGFDIYTQANNARVILAKLDIIDGLSKFYGESYPVLMDNAECVSQETRSRYNYDGQIIEFFVTEYSTLIIE